MTRYRIRRVLGELRPHLNQGTVTLCIYRLKNPFLFQRLCLKVTSSVGLTT